MTNPIEKDYEKYAIAFNHKPKEAVKLIVQACEKSGDDPSKVIVKFFKDQKRNLNLEKVGEFLSEDPNQKENKLNAAVLAEFSKGFNFKGKEFVPAMREYLDSFKLPGESQKIDRLMESFAANYHRDNPDKIKAPDAAYTLAFSTIMLNTDLHNPSIKKTDKMTFPQFVNNNRGQNEGKNFSPEMLDKIYQDIKAKPFKFNFSETTPKYKFDASNIAKDAVYKNLSKKDLTIDDIKKACPLIKDRDFTVEQDRNISSKTKDGRTSAITLTDKASGEKTTIKVFKPNLKSRLTSNKNASITVIPSLEKTDEPMKSFKFAAQIAAGIKSSCDISSTYKYQSEHMVKALNTAQKAHNAHQSKEKESVQDQARKLRPKIADAKEKPKIIQRIIKKINNIRNR